MTVQTVNAVYEGGLFRLIEPATVDLPDGHPVRITVTTDTEMHDALSLVTGIFDGLSEQEVDEITKIAQQRGGFFGDRS